MPTGGSEYGCAQDGGKRKKKAKTKSADYLPTINL